MSAAFDDENPFESLKATACAPFSVPAFGKARDTLDLHGSAADVADLATRAAILEVAATPKPGLVCIDRNGAHADMDYALFVRSALSLRSYFQQAHTLGEATRTLPPETVFPGLRTLGIAAEQRMFAATDGVNTHKGLLFSLGLFCAASGRLSGTHSSVDELCRTAAAFAGDLACTDFATLPHGPMVTNLFPTGRCLKDTPQAARPHLETALGRKLTAGETLYLLHGIAGIRGEAAQGFPHVQLAWEALWRHGVDTSANTALVHCLLELVCSMDDTNILWRGGLEGLAFAREQAQDVLALGGLHTRTGRERLHGMCTAFERRRLSPGGCADMLAVAVFLHLLRRRAES